MSEVPLEIPTGLVVTSIASPNAVLRELAGQCKARGISFYVIGDLPSPPDFQLDGCEFYSLERQRSTGLRLIELLPTRHYARKNIGYLLAMQSGARLLLETDDDNMPMPAFWEKREQKVRSRSLTGFGWANAYAYFSEAMIWPRGLPLDAANSNMPQYDALPEMDVDCPIQQGLADGNPDVDAIYRMLLPVPIYFREGRRVAFANGTWCPFNSQNTAWFPDAFPLLYLPSTCTFRMTDIWRSLVAQRIAFENGWSILFGSPDVVQERNEHDLTKDFADEVPGYLHNRTIQDRLQQLNLKAGTERIGESLMLCYEELIRLSLVRAEELPMVDAWIQDIAGLR